MHKTICSAMLALCTYAQQSSATINVLLANSRGMVLATDSRLTRIDANGNLLGFIDTGQKLFQLDEATVCSFAGTAQQPGLVENLDIRTGGVIRSLEENLSKKHEPISFEAKVHLVANSLLDHYAIWFDTLNEHSATTKPGPQIIQLLLAGYDLDGKAKIAKAVITIDAVQLGATFDIHSVETGLLYLTAGADEPMKARLLAPQAYADDSILEEYAQAENKHSLDQIDVSHLQALAEDLKKAAVDKENVVGGATQLAILQNGHVVVQPVAGLQIPPMFQPLVLVINGSGNNSVVPSIQTSYPTDYIDFNCNHGSVVLDKNTFYGGIYDHCAFFYDGGPHPPFDRIAVLNSTLVLGPHIQNNDSRVTAILHEEPSITLVPFNRSHLPQAKIDSLWPKIP